MGVFASKSDAWKHTDLSNKVILMTGSNSGIGFEAAKELAKRNAHVILASRSEERSKPAVEEITLQAQRHGSKGKAEWMHVDLTSFRSVQEFVGNFERRNLPLHMLVNDASLFIPQTDFTDDGIEVTLQTNYFSHFLLAQLLLDKLKQSKPARLIWVASGTEASAPQQIDYNNLVGKGFSSDYRTYATSKEWSLMAMKEFQRRIEGSGVNVYMVQPGLARTNIFSKMDKSKPSAWVMDLSQWIYAQPASQGAVPIVYCACAPETELTGRGGGWVYGPPYKRFWPGLPLVVHFFTSLNTQMQEPTNPLIRDDNECRRLYEATAKIVSEKAKVPVNV